MIVVLDACIGLWAGFAVLSVLIDLDCIKLSALCPRITTFYRWLRYHGIVGTGADDAAWPGFQ